MNDVIERPTAIIITFSLQLIIDIGNNLLLQKNGRYDKEKQFIGRKWYYAAQKKDVIKAGYKGYLQYVKYYQQNPDKPWYHKMANIPKHDVLFAYVTCLGKIQYKWKIAGFVKNDDIECYDGTKAKNWCLLHEPQLVKPEIKLGGFQGFRYWKEDYDS